MSLNSLAREKNIIINIQLLQKDFANLRFHDLKTEPLGSLGNDPVKKSPLAGRFNIVSPILILGIYIFYLQAPFNQAEAPSDDIH